MKEEFYHGYAITATADYNSKDRLWRGRARITWSSSRQQIDLKDKACCKTQAEAEKQALEMGKRWVDHRLGGVRSA